MAEYKKNEVGQLLMDLEDVMAASGQIANYTRYNGGWIRHVTGLDTKKTDGYSILGDFVKDGIQWQDPGLYLDCSIGGSRKNQERWFTLFVLTPDGEIQKVGKWWKISGSSGGTWAPHFWDEIEAQLARLRQEKTVGMTEEDADRILNDDVLRFMAKEVILGFASVRAALREEYKERIAEVWAARQAAKAARHAEHIDETKREMNE